VKRSAVALGEYLRGVVSTSVIEMLRQLHSLLGAKWVSFASYAALRYPVSVPNVSMDRFACFSMVAEH